MVVLNYGSDNRNMVTTGMSYCSKLSKRESKLKIYASNKLSRNSFGSFKFRASPNRRLIFIGDFSREGLCAYKPASQRALRPVAANIRLVLRLLSSKLGSPTFCSQYYIMSDA